MRRRATASQLCPLGTQRVINLDGVVENAVFPMPKGLALGNKAPETGAGR